MRTSQFYSSISFSSDKICSLIHLFSHNFLLFLLHSGTRFRILSFNTPEPLFPLAGQPMVGHLINSCKRVFFTSWNVIFSFDRFVIWRTFTVCRKRWDLGLILLMGHIVLYNWNFVGRFSLNLHSSIQKCVGNAAKKNLNLGYLNQD